MCLWTPALSAIAEIVVRAGPTEVCSATVASTIRRRVSASPSARFFFWYVLVITHQCTLNLT